MTTPVVAACMASETCGKATPVYLRPKDGGEPTTETARRWKAEFLAKHPAPLHVVTEKVA